MAISTPADRSLRQLVDSGERPFPSHPQVDRYFPAAAIEDARRRLSRAIDRGDGPGLVIGGAGTGKTLLLQALAAQFHQRFDVVLLGCARICTRRALLQTILFELGLPHRLRDEGRLRLTLLDHLLSAKQTPNDLLLLVDEAQTLPVALLDELRVMTNLIRGGVPRVRLVMAGSPLLEDTFASPELESLSQRLAARSYMTPFSREETAQYIRAQLHASRAAVDEVLRPEAWEAVFEATDGVPRLVNQLCDRAILVATSENCLRLDRRVVQDAWSDLQQLPSPWHTTVAATAPAASIVEFGGLAQDDAFDQEVIEPESFDRDDLVTTSIEAETAEQIAPPSVPRPIVPQKKASDPANPFDEAFEEEEVVIDNHASLGNMFSYGAPRVENRRDPEFTSMVRAAIDAASAAEERNQPTPTDQLEAGDMDTDGVDELPLSVEHARSASPYDAFPVIDEIEVFHPAQSQPPEPDDLIDEMDPHWPPIRLAFARGLDAADEPTPDWEDRGQTDLSQPNTDDEMEWRSFRNMAAETAADAYGGTDELIMIVEDEHVEVSCVPTFESPRPQVRRQEYRRLFSRLRSG